MINNIFFFWPRGIYLEDDKNIIDNHLNWGNSMEAKDFMSTKLISCKEQNTVEDAAKLMTENGLSIIPIVDENQKLLGIVTESDFIGKEANIPHALASIKQLFGNIFYFDKIEPIYNKAKKYPLSQVMTKNPTTVTPNTSLTNIVNLMISHNLKRLPVIDQDKLVGIITRKDLIKAFLKSSDKNN